MKRTLRRMAGAQEPKFFLEKYSPDEYTLHYGGVAGILKSLFLGDKTESRFACFECVTEGSEMEQDPHDACTPEPMRWHDRSNPSIRRDLNAESELGFTSQQFEEYDMAGGYAGSNVMRDNEGGEAAERNLKERSEGTPRGWFKRRVQIRQEIEIKESQIAIKVKKLIRLQEDLNVFKSKLERLQVVHGNGENDASEVKDVKDDLGQRKRSIEATRVELAKLNAQLKELREISGKVEDAFICRRQSSSAVATFRSPPPSPRPMPSRASAAANGRSPSPTIDLSGPDRPPITGFGGSGSPPRRNFLSGASFVDRNLEQSTNREYRSPRVLATTIPSQSPRQNVPVYAVAGSPPLGISGLASKNRPPLPPPPMRSSSVSPGN